MELLFGVDLPIYLLLLFIAVFLLYLYGTWSFGIWKSLGVDGPAPLPFFGHQWEIKKKGYENSIRKWSQTYGRTYGIYCGRRPLLVTTDLDILKEVLVKDFNRFADRFDKFELFPKELRPNLFIIGGADWKRVRTLLTPTFSSGKLKLMENHIDRCCINLTENLQEAIRKGERIDAKKYFGGYTLDVISSTAFGIQVNSQKDLNDPFVKDVASVMHEAASFDGLLTVLAASVQFLVPVIKFLAIYLFPLTRWNSLLKNVNRIINERKQEKSRNAHTDFLQMIVSYEDPEGFAKGQMKSLSRTEVIAQAMLFFVAGYDTTSTALQFLAYNLACCPEAQEKVVQEIQNLIGDGKPTYEGVAKLKYLDSVVQETLRMFPPLNTVNRMASEEVTIKGVTIPKGAGVCVPIANVMRDPEYFPDPDVFKPDRFIEGADGFVNPFSNLVFGFGPRQCIGMRLALLQIKMAMVHVFRKVRFIKTDDLKETPARKPGSFLSIVEKPLFISAVLRETAT
ncbi:cytochrome P450 3A24-like [Pomacea canaliculata]|uniref:cytochrome P450 3A24-like n=1 Tax=Pomacea canaliculata TaxID=400727 RepID=UPI000D73923D|nr:cytochrome P450 3A24-like [Pomacea canaliculata]